MGLKDFVVTSDAVKISAPKYLQKAQKKLARLQRRLSRRQKGSRGRDKARLAVARQHEKIANQRSDFLHKTSRWLVDNYGLIGIEDLNVRGMVKNHKLAKAISDVGWGELKRQLLYKGQWYGSQVVVIDRFYPSSRECSACHSVLPELKLSVREWDCPVCGAYHDRDLNAAKNILNQAQTRAGTVQSNADGEGVKLGLKTELSSAKSEEPLGLQPSGGSQPVLTINLSIDYLTGSLAADASRRAISRLACGRARALLAAATCCISAGSFTQRRRVVTTSSGSGAHTPAPFRSNETRRCRLPDRACGCKGSAAGRR